LANQLSSAPAFSVYDVLSWLADGMSISDIIADFPELTEDQIKACLSYKQ
jgi:uncharacterized protein (DUF433 family)